MQSAISNANAKRAKPKSRDLGQFDLFSSFKPDADATKEAAPVKVAQATDAPPVVMRLEPARSGETRSHEALRVSAVAAPNRAASPRRPVRIFAIAEEDLPEYSEDEKAIVDRTLEALPQTKAWFTYADIKQCFTISRATVVRRMKSGVVPGIRFAGDRVLEDGNIRRFTREQVRYLLLAIRRPVR